jgi:hypothetical protein
MSQQSIPKKQSGTWGDAAVDGLFSGLAAGLVMAAYLLIIVALAGNSPADFFAWLAPGETASPVLGGLLHVAVSGVYGAIFGALTSRISILRSGPKTMLGSGSGIIYGLGMLTVAQSIILPALGSPLTQLPFGHKAMSHVLYGLVLGFLTLQRDA